MRGKRFPRCRQDALLSGIRIHDPIDLINFRELGLSRFFWPSKIKPGVEVVAVN